MHELSGCVNTPRRKQELKNGKAGRNWVREHPKWDSPPFSFPQRPNEEVPKRSENFLFPLIV